MNDKEIGSTVDAESFATGLINAIYRGFLQREPDPDGLAAHLRLFERNPPAQALQIAIERTLRSSEFARRWQGGAWSTQRSIATKDIQIFMMTYNEEQLLPYSLPVLREHFTNFLFLDMGSADRTRSIIRRVLDNEAQFEIINYKREHLFEFGYAHARNFASTHASSPWLLAIDADEILAAGVQANEILIDEFTDQTAIVIAERHNLVSDGWKVGESFEPGRLKNGKTEYKKRLYRTGAGTRWRGYIHEDLVDPLWADSRAARSQLVLEHLSNCRDPKTQLTKRQMYAWMLLRVYREEALRDGVSRAWYEDFVPKNLPQLETDAKAFVHASGRWLPRRLRLNRLRAETPHRSGATDRRLKAGGA